MSEYLRRFDQERNGDIWKCPTEVVRKEGSDGPDAKLGDGDTGDEGGLASAKDGKTYSQP